MQRSVDYCHPQEVHLAAHTAVSALQNTASERVRINRPDRPTRALLAPHSRRSGYFPCQHGPWTHRIIAICDDALSYPHVIHNDPQ